MDTWKALLTISTLLLIFSTTVSANTLGEEQDDHRGKYLHIAMSTGDNGDRLYDMFLTDQKLWEDNGNVDSSLSEFNSSLMITEPSNGDIWLDLEYERGAYNISIGQRISSNGDALSATSQTNYNTEDELRGLVTGARVDGDAGSNDNCEHNACELMTKPLDSSIQDSVDQKDLYNPSDKIPVYASTDTGAHYDFQGNVIKAYEPKTAASDGLSGEGPFFYICRDESRGMIVDTDGGNTQSGLYRCTGSNTWETTYACQDGLDNDGDGQIDKDSPDALADDDAGCSSETDDTEYTSGYFGSADPTFAKAQNVYPEGTDVNQDEYIYTGSKTIPSDPEKVVTLYRGDLNRYSRMNTSIYSHSPIQFHCDENGDISSLNTDGISSPYAEELRSDAQVFCNNYATANSDEKDKHFHANHEILDAAKEVKTSLYFINPEMLLSDNYVDNELIDGVDDNSFTEDENNLSESNNIKGPENWKFQTLHQAETQSMIQLSVPEGNTPNEEKTYYNYNLKKEVTDTFSTQHNDESYHTSGADGRFTFFYGETSNIPSQYHSVWTMANANNETTSNTGEGFTGGYHPTCVNNMKWRNIDNQGWKCSYGPVEITTNFYQRDLETGDTSLEGNWVGFQINDSELMKWNNAFPTNYQGDSSYAEPLTVRAQCWAGKRGSRPATVFGDDSKAMNMKVPLHGSGQATSGDDKTVASFIAPNRLSTAEFQEDRYSCIYAITQQITNNATDIKGIKLYNSTGSSINGNIDDLGTHLDDGGKAYLIQGTEQYGNVDMVKGETITPGGSNKNATEQEDWLYENTDVTQAFPETQIWNMFPKGGTVYSTNERDIKHPGVAFDSVYSDSPHASN